MANTSSPLLPSDLDVTVTVPVRLSPRAAHRLADLVRTVPALDVRDVRDAIYHVYCTIVVTGSPADVDAALLLVDDLA